MQIECSSVTPINSSNANIHHYTLAVVPIPLTAIYIDIHIMTFNNYNGIKKEY